MPKTAVKSKKKIQRRTVSEKGGQIGREAAHLLMESTMLPRRVVLQIADEVGKVVAKSLSVRRHPKKTVKVKVENPIFLDTSAIIDTRIFDLAKLGVFTGNFVVLEGVLSELKNIADSKDDTKKERGRRAMKLLENFKKQKGVKITILDDSEFSKLPVDERIIAAAKKDKAKIITCDFNLSKKARIGNVVSVDLYEMANILKTTALPGEEFFVKIVQSGKGEGQGVGYLPDGTMLVVERGKLFIGKTIQVVVSRIIQTDAGKIFFAKIKEA